VCEIYPAALDPMTCSPPGTRARRLFLRGGRRRRAAGLGSFALSPRRAAGGARRGGARG
jgi:hypothetical protein